MFFQSFACKGFSSEGKESQGWKNVKAQDHCCIFRKQIVIWRSKKPRCFRLASAPDKLTEVSYFDDSKSWMQVEITKKIFDTLNFQMRKERRNATLVLDNVTVQPISLIDMYSNIKIVFLPKNKTSRLQPLNARIIQSFKTKYRKKLMRYVIARRNDALFASEIAKGIDILQAITWVADALKEVSVEMIKNCFAKWDITEETSEDEDGIWMRNLTHFSTNSQIQNVTWQGKIMTISMLKNAARCLQSAPIW